MTRPGDALALFTSLQCVGENGDIPHPNPLIGTGRLLRQTRGYNDCNELTGEVRCSDAAGSRRGDDDPRHNAAGNLTGLHYQEQIGRPSFHDSQPFSRPQIVAMSP